MPAMHLMRVDLPAPLSPTRAMTSPGETWKSTSNRACTAPKLFETPFSSRIGGLSVTLSTLLRVPVDDGPPPSGGAPLAYAYSPASVQSDAYLPTQTSSFLRNPSSRSALW